MNKKIEDVIAERDILGTQLVKKNDELNLQDSKIKLLQVLLDTRERQYEQRLNDVRLLKLEIQRLKQEKSLLSKGIENTTDLRLEVFNLERELNRERLRSRALEEAVETPQNIHRWRKLEDTDPSTLELINQIHMLQKQSLNKSQKLKELKAIQHENPKVDLDVVNEKAELSKLKKTMMRKDVKLKAVTAELKMREAQVNEHKQNKPKFNGRNYSKQKQIKLPSQDTRSVCTPKTALDILSRTPQSDN